MLIKAYEYSYVIPTQILLLYKLHNEWNNEVVDTPQKLSICALTIVAS